MEQKMDMIKIEVGIEMIKTKKKEIGKKLRKDTEIELKQRNRKSK